MKKYQNNNFIMSIICILISIIGVSLSIYTFILGKTIAWLLLILNSLAMIGNSITFYCLWKRSKNQKNV